MAHKPDSPKYLVGHFLIHICESRIIKRDNHNKKSHKTPGLALENEVKVNSKRAKKKKKWSKTIHLLFLLLVESIPQDATNGSLENA